MSTISSVKVTAQSWGLSTMTDPHQWDYVLERFGSKSLRELREYVREITGDFDAPVDSVFGNLIIIAEHNTHRTPKQIDFDRCWCGEPALYSKPSMSEFPAARWDGRDVDFVCSNHLSEFDEYTDLPQPLEPVIALDVEITLAWVALDDEGEPRSNQVRESNSLAFNLSREKVLREMVASDEIKSIRIWWRNEGAAADTIVTVKSDHLTAF